MTTILLENTRFQGEALRSASECLKLAYDGMALANAMAGRDGAPAPFMRTDQRWSCQSLGVYGAFHDAAVRAAEDMYGVDLASRIMQTYSEACAGMEFLPKVWNHMANEIISDDLIAMMEDQG